LPAAYFFDGIEYSFEYQLDAQGRVENYRISRRPGAAYPTPAESDANLIECTGSLHGAYDCRGTAPAASQYPRTMQGETGRSLVFDDWNGVVAQQFSASHVRMTYAYQPGGLDSVAWEWETASIHRRGSGSEKLDYDERGRLASVHEASIACYFVCPSTTADIPVTVDSTGRLQRAERIPITVPATSLPPGTRRETTWRYDDRGLMEEVVATSFDDLGVAVVSSTRYAADADGWLTSRVTRSRNRDGAATETDDQYSILRSKGYVAEERFTQAEPRGFYQLRAQQRVRYEANRLPTEPLFVPRALTGLRGADYFGIISSHDR
jgi:hypothetical protein